MNKRLESIIIGTCIALLVLGASLGVLTLPVLIDVLVPAVGAPDASGLSELAAVETAQRVRAYVMTPDAEALPRSVEGRAGFNPDAVSHLEDVRDVIARGRRATLFCLVIVIGWLAVSLRQGRIRSVGGGLRAGSLVLSIGVPLVLLLGVADFEWFFAGFHALFFEAGTWQFPKGDLLIQLFPEAFWMVAGAVWATLILLGAAGLWVSARVLERSGER